MKNHFYLSTLACLICLSCIKKKVEKTEPINCEPTFVEQSSPDTLYPSDYMPAYPGSYWKLVQNNPTYPDTLTKNCTSWIKKSAFYPISLEGCGSFYSKSSWVTDTYGVPQVWGEKMLFGFSNEYKIEIPVFGTNSIDTTLYPEYKTSGKDKIVIQSTSIPELTVNGTTYVDVKSVSYSFWSNGHFGFYPIGGTTYYFAKNVGLIRVYDPFHYIQHDLIDYYIAPH